MGPANPGTEAEERSNGHCRGHAPATGLLIVLRRWQPGDRWTVRNLAGQVLSVPGVPSGDRMVLDVSALAGGIYVVEVIGAEGREVGRVVVR